MHIPDSFYSTFESTQNHPSMPKLDFFRNTKSFNPALDNPSGRRVDPGFAEIDTPVSVAATNNSSLSKTDIPTKQGASIRLDTFPSDLQWTASSAYTLTPGANKNPTQAGSLAAVDGGDLPPMLSVGSGASGASAVEV